MDVLINGELQPEELIRLGSFSDDEANTIITSSSGNWWNKIANPSSTVSLNGYNYLINTLGLINEITLALNAVSGEKVSLLLNSYISIGPNGHVDQAEVEYIFKNRILLPSLNSIPYEYIFPSNATEFKNIPISNRTVDKENLVLYWGESMLSPLFFNLSSFSLNKILSVGNVDSVFRVYPSLAEWIFTDPFPSYNTKILLQREASERTLFGSYTYNDLIDKANHLISYQPDYISTGSKLSYLYTQIKILDAATTTLFPSDSILTDKVNLLKDSFQAIINHRNRIRTFLNSVIANCQIHLIGKYFI
jgi:hypothetical protein